MSNDTSSETVRLVHELEEAELYQQSLRGRIVAIRDALAAGHTGEAMSLCNQVLNDIDDQTDVVAHSPSR